MASFSGNPSLPTAHRLPAPPRAEGCPLGAAHTDADLDHRGALRRWTQRIRRPGGAFWAASISSLVHAMLLIACQWWLLPPRAERTQLALEVSTIHRAAVVDAVDFAPTVAAESADSTEPQQLDVGATAARLSAMTSIAGHQAEPIRLELSAATLMFGNPGKLDLLAKVSGSELSGLAAARSAAGRRGSISAGGATPESESAVDRGLQWLVQHQFADGGWSFDHRQKACKGHCDHPGTMAQARVAATAMALLPLLGAGHTHRQGPYKKAVQGGLAFLGHSVRLVPEGGDLQAGGMMYSHGLATIALCEAFAMTKDRQLVAPAQAALNFIAAAQDPQGGGWRYTPGMPGDTSVFGWQLMALKSGHMGYLSIPPRTIAGAIHFLDSVQTDNGAQYGYTVGQDRGEADRATTAIGLLSRMYLGWKRDDAALERGTALLDHWGPSDSDLYYDYYATQVLRHYEGDIWQRWNTKLRNRLVETQALRGHEAGSWYITDPCNDIGGRLYCTALSVMILEVYYRHLPLYQKHTTGEAF